MLHTAKSLNDLTVYKLAQELANWVFEIADEHFPPPREHHARKSIKKAVKTVEAHIAKSFHHRDKKEHSTEHTVSAYNSLIEIKNLMVHAHKMSWITDEILQEFFDKHAELKQKLDQQLSDLT